MSQPALESLFQRFLATGDERALEQWMRRSSPGLRRLARRLGVNDDDTDDLIQETFLAAIHGADRYDGNRPLLPWLKGILTFRAARLARADVRRRRHCETAHRGKETTAPPADPCSAELDGDVRAAIDDLPERYREPLLQYLLDQRSPVEIAEDLGVERSTVRVQLHRGLQRLRDALRRWATLLLVWLFGREVNAMTAARVATLLLVGIAVAAIAADTDTRSPSSGTASVAMLASQDDTVGQPDEANRPERTATRVPRPSTTSSFEVLVHDESGRGIAGIGVRVTPRLGRDPVLHQRNRVTDADGRARWLDLARGEHLVSTDRGPHARIDLRSERQSHTFTIATANRLRGLALLPDGTPAANARIWLGEDVNDPWRGEDVATTDDHGHFELRAVRAGSFVAARHDRFARGELQQLTADDLQNGLTLRLGRRGSSANIVITTADGEPVADAVVHVGDSMDSMPLWLAQGAAPRRTPPFRARSDADGRVRTGALAIGDHQVFVRAAGFAPARHLLRVGPGAPREHPVILRPSGVITGQLVDEHGHPVTDALTVLRHANAAASVDLWSDADGRFRFDCVPAGPCQVLARAPGMVTTSRRLQVASGNEHHLQLRMPRTTIVDGQVIIAHERDPTRTELLAQWPDSALRRNRVLTITDDTGAFTLPNEFGSRPRLFARLHGEPLWRAIDAHATWSEGNLRIELPPGFRATSWVSGACRSDDASAIGDARLFVEGEDGSWQEVGRTDAHGHYRIGPLPAGRYRIFAESRSPTCPTIADSFFTIAANATATRDLNATATGELEVELRRDDGQPVVDALVTIQRADLHRRFAIAHDAAFTRRLVAGDYVVSAMGSRFEWIDAFPVRVVAGARTRAVIDLRSANNFTLALEGLPPRPLDAAARLRMYGLARPDFDKTFDLLPDAPPHIGAVLSPGNYAIEYDHVDGTRWRGEFAVAIERDGLAPLRVAMRPTPR